MTTKLPLSSQVISKILPYAPETWMNNANGTRTMLLPTWEPANNVRGRFDNRPFRCYCQEVPGSHVHWDGCKFNNECLRRLKVEGPYDPRYILDGHQSNKDGTITRIQMPVKTECGCRGHHIDTCTYGLFPTYPCHCKFLDPRNPIHWDLCPKIRHERETRTTTTRAKLVGGQPDHRVWGSSLETSRWTPSLKDFSDADLCD